MQNWNKKRVENLLFWKSHSYVNRDLQKRKVFTLFSNQRAARSFNSFSKSGPSCEIIAHPWSKHNQSHVLVVVIMRKIRGSISRPVKSNSTTRRSLRRFFGIWSCVAKVLNRGDGPHLSLHATV